MRPRGIGWLDVIREDFLAAADSAVRQLAESAVAAAWERPSALERLTVGALAAHLARQVQVVDELLDLPEAAEEPVSLQEHFDRSAWIGVDLDHEANVRVRHQSTEAAAGGPQAVAERADAALARLRGRLPDAPDRRVRQATWPHSLRLDDFLLTRMLELVVHSDDLAVSLGLPTPRLPDHVTEPVLDVLTRIAVRRHGTTAVLRTLSRAERAPETIAAI